MNYMRPIVLLVVLLLPTRDARAQADDYDQLIVLNSLSETISTVDRVDESVELTSATLGLVPNRLRIADDSLLLVVHSGNAALWVYSVPGLQFRRSIALPGGSNPWDVVVWDDTLCAVTLVLDNAIAWVDYQDGSVEMTEPVGKSPQGMLVQGAKLYVANSGFDYGTFLYDPGTVSILEGPGDASPETIAVGLNPQVVTKGPDSTLHVLCTGDFFSVFGIVYRYYPSSGVVDSLALGGSPGDLVIDGHGIGYIAAGGWRPGPGLLYRYDANSFTGLNNAGNPWTIPDSGVIAVYPRQEGGVYAVNFDGDAISELDTAGTEVHKWLVGDGPVAMVEWTSRTPGNVNEILPVNVLDVVALIDYVFRSGPAPDRPASADGNGDCVVNVLDVVALIDYVFRSGPVVYWGCA